ncbi:hypothetical protein C0J45_22077 [Silurus meridionalis]|nr:hypothetical protein C0J45_22077 [Silurus meridionalis]
MKIVLVLMAVCFIALSFAVPVEDEHEREKRSSSGESYRGGGQYMPSFIPYNMNPGGSNSMQNILYTLLLARLLTPPAPAPAPPATPPKTK